VRGVGKELDVSVDTPNAPLLHMTQAAARATESTVFSAIGHTPLIRLAAIRRDLPGVEIYAKAEWLNPGGSVKDRPALNMVLILLLGWLYTYREGVLGWK
jgi:threonine dehydratase